MLFVPPKQAPAHVEDLYLDVHSTARSVVIDDELRGSGGRIARQGHAEKVWTQTLFDYEVKPCGRRVVENVPRL